MGRIIVAGIGPGNPAYMLPAARQAIAEAKVLVGGSRALQQYSHAGQRTMAIKADIGAVMEFIGRELDNDDVVVMVSGDPGYYSLLDALKREFDADAIKVIPGISSLQYAFAAIGQPWHDAELLSFHGRVPAEERLTHAPGKLLGFLTDTKNNSQTIPQILLAHGWPAEAACFICQRLSYDDEKITAVTLEEAAAREGVGNCVLIVKA